MMWAADFDDAMTRRLEENCLEPLMLNLRTDSRTEMKGERLENGKRKFKSMRPRYRNGQTCRPFYSSGVRSITSHPLCGLAKANFWQRDDLLHNPSASKKNMDDELPVFCVAAILIINRQKIMRETNSMDDIIKASIFLSFFLIYFSCQLFEAYLTCD